MALSKNTAVRKAYEEGFYTTQEGDTWRKGMDGWFLVHDGDDIILSWHHHFVELIEKENPE
jgi:hypothetical protein